MSKIADVAAYFCKHYPHKSELSKTRLTKLVYLADWEAAKRKGRQVTDIEWYFHNFGPYVDDVIEAVQEDPRFEIIQALNYYGEPKVEVRLSGKEAASGGLDNEEINILDSVIETTSPMYWDSLSNTYTVLPQLKSLIVMRN